MDCEGRKRENIFADDKILYVLNSSPCFFPSYFRNYPSSIALHPNIDQCHDQLKLALPRTVSRNFRDEALNVYSSSADIFFAEPFMEEVERKRAND
jgi:hypothetical protein